MDDKLVARSESEDLVLEPGVLLETAKGQFRLQNRYVLLTYKTHLDKTEFESWLKEKDPSVTWLRLAHETGDENCPYEHTHVVIDFGKTKQTTSCRYFDYLSEDGFIHPHIKKLIGKKAFEDAKKYIAKEDPDNADLLAKPCWIEGVLNSKTAVDALKKYAERPTDVNGILSLHAIGQNDFRKRNKKEFIPRNWQQELHDELVKEPDDRHITWIYDEEGNSGKTAFGKWMEDLYPEKFIYTTDLGTTRDAATIIGNALQNGWEAWGMFINLSRTAENHDRMYSYIEELKDGRVTAQKYNGRVIRFDSPHIVIFANWMPKISNLSADRWKIRKMTCTPQGEYLLGKPIKRIVIKKRLMEEKYDGFTSSLTPTPGEEGSCFYDDRGYIDMKPDH